MLRARIIPCLLVQDSGLVKTTRFGSPKYVGDPINAVRIFNEKEVDELIVVDIDATRHGREPNYRLIEILANECRMPLCYGGGVGRVEQIERIVGLGVEKVALGAALHADARLLPEAAARVGSQSVVAVLDVQKTGLLRKYEVVTHNATRRTGRDPVSFARAVQDLGAGEILLNNVDRDGVMKGYDRDVIAAVRAATSLPLTLLGGAGSLDDIGGLVRDHGVIGAAAGSLFVFKGKYRAVLISYPTPDEKDRILAEA